LTAREVLLGEMRSGADLRTLVVAPDGQHVAYLVQSGLKQAVVVDNVQGREYNSIAQNSITFSPDSRRVAYVTRAGGGFFSAEKSVVVIDGQEEKKYHQICKQGPVFSPNSRKVAYGAGLGGKWFVVSNGQEAGEVRAAPKGVVPVGIY
jgi:hypothetical protein